MDKDIVVKCPCCKIDISVFSKVLNSSGKVRTCPQCKEQLVIGIDYKKALILLPLFAVVHVFLLGPFLRSIGYGNIGPAFLIGSLLIYVSTKLKKYTG